MKLKPSTLWPILLVGAATVIASTCYFKAKPTSAKGVDLMTANEICVKRYPDGTKVMAKVTTFSYATPNPPNSL